jgi:hypothetical protein
MQEGRIIKAVENLVTQILEKKLTNEPMRSLAPTAVIKKNPFHASPLYDTSQSTESTGKKSPETVKNWFWQGASCFGGRRVAVSMSRPKTVSNAVQNQFSAVS